MAKTSLRIADDLVVTKRGWTHAFKLAAVIGVAVLLAPIVWEGGAMLLSNWFEVMGKTLVVRTPVLDYLSQTYEGSREDLHDFLVPYLGSMSWRPELIFPVLLVMMGVGMKILWRAPN